jgi:hypothetical protein
MNVIITSFWKQQGIQTWISILTEHLHGVSKGSKVAGKQASDSYKACLLLI